MAEKYVPTENNVKLNFVQRLNKAVMACRQLKKITDDKNHRMLSAYASGYYKEKKSKDPHPLNMIDRAVSIWLPFLVGGLPKIIIEPKINIQFKPFAHTFQLALNQWMKEVKFATRTLEPAVLYSLFSQGITKTGTQRADMKMISGYLTETNKPFCEVVDCYNYIFDITAKDREQYEFEGDEYILPTEEARELFPKYADKIKPDFYLYGEKDPRKISNPDKVPYNELHEYSAFIDLWLPKEDVLITILPPNKDFNRILKTTDFEGSQSGPYDVLGYKHFEGTTIPIPPIYSLMELDAAINRQYHKATNQIDRLKKLGVYESGNERDAQTARDAKDGDLIGISNAQIVKEVTLGGVEAQIYDFLGFSLAQFSEQGGNLAVAGGRKSMSKTLGQEEMLMMNASRTLEKMSQKVHQFASDIAQKLAYEMWVNPTMQIKAKEKIAGIAEIPIIYDQYEQEGEFTDYYLDVEMFSMQRLSPEARFQKMFQLITAWILPTMQIAAQQGKMLNVPEVTKTLSYYLDIDTDGWFLSEQPMQTQMNPYQQMSTKTRSSDQRFGSSEADNLNNLMQHNNSRMSQGKEV